MINTNDIFNIKSTNDFENKALQVFKYQFENNSVYRSFCDLLYKHPSDIKRIEDIPFLPIQFFKSHKILSNSMPIEQTFTSSGTTGSTISKHYITNLSIYENSFNTCFKQFYGNVKNYTILALLPSYLERQGSSLVYMVNQLIAASNKPESGFYLNNHSKLIETLERLDRVKMYYLLACPLLY
jgi:phenylacetate-coenzyme A ligase PaaK-like adenylate-forming protein